MFSCSHPVDGHIHRNSDVSICWYAIPQYDTTHPTSGDQSTRGRSQKNSLRILGMNFAALSAPDQIRFSLICEHHRMFSVIPSAPWKADLSVHTR